MRGAPPAAAAALVFPVPATAAERTAKLRRDEGGAAQVRFRILKRGLSLRVVVPEASGKPYFASGVSEIVRS